ncbi:hypothetical protein [Novipirellula caenicola]|uniref:Secreted protein n=1 Tax=Novipirellula caenicola TaxID=1536901 RepID=A0ABP9VIE8_9BACT
MMKHLNNLLRQIPLALLLMFSVVSLAGCDSSGNSVVVAEDGPMTEQELEDYEKQVNEQQQNYEDRYR